MAPTAAAGEHLAHLKHNTHGDKHRRSAPPRVVASPMQGIWSKLRAVGNKASPECNNCQPSPAHCSLPGPALLPALIDRFGLDWLSLLASDMNRGLRTFTLLASVHEGYPLSSTSSSSSSLSSHCNCSEASPVAAALPSPSRLAALLDLLAAGDAEAAASVHRTSLLGPAAAAQLLASGAAAALSRALENCCSNAKPSAAAAAAAAALNVGTALHLCLLHERAAVRLSEEGLVMTVVQMLRRMGEAKAAGESFLAGVPSVRVDLAALLFCLMHSEARVHVAVAAGAVPLLWQLLITAPAAGAAAAAGAVGGSVRCLSVRVAASLALLRLTRVDDVAQQLVEGDALAVLADMLLQQGPAAAAAAGRAELAALLCSLTRSETGVTALCTVDGGKGGRAIAQLLLQQQQGGLEGGRALLVVRFAVAAVCHVSGRGAVFARCLVQRGVVESLESLESLEGMEGMEGRYKASGGSSGSGGVSGDDEHREKLQSSLAALRAVC